MHAICISDKSFVQLERHTFNRNRVMSKTRFTYMVLYKVITEKRKTSPDYMADKTRNSSTYVWNRQKLCAQKTNLLDSQSKHQNTFLLWKLSLLYIQHWHFFLPHEGKVSLSSRFAVSSEKLAGRCLILSWPSTWQYFSRIITTNLEFDHIQSGKQLKPPSLPLVFIVCSLCRAVPSLAVRHFW